MPIAVNELTGSIVHVVAQAVACSGKQSSTSIKTVNNRADIVAIRPFSYYLPANKVAERDLVFSKAAAK